jgi:hypothetical protein
VEVKSLFSTAPDAKKRRRKELIRVTGRVTGRWIRHGWRVRSSHPACKGSSAHTGMSGQALEKLRNTRGRLDTFDRVWVLTRIDRMLVLWCLVSSSSAFGRVVSNAIQRRPDAATASGQFDRRVRLVRWQRQLVPNSSILWGCL